MAAVGGGIVLRFTLLACVLMVVAVAARPRVVAERFQTHKVCVVTHGSNRKYLQTMLWYLLDQKRRNEFDEWVIFKTTTDILDDRYLDAASGIHSWITVQGSDDLQPDRSLEVARFTTRSDTIYIKLDHNIVCIDEHFVRSLVDARLQNPEYFLVLPNIINHGLVASLYRQNGVFNAPLGYDDLDGETAKRLHEKFLADFERGKMSVWSRAFDRFVKEDYSSISLPAVAYFGSDFSDLQIAAGTGDVDRYLSSTAAQKKKKHILFVGSPVCVNYATAKQRATLDASNVLQRYVDHTYLVMVDKK